jgi:hypothetical protein
MMPRRKRTRAADRMRRILEERARNDAYVAERNRPPPFKPPTADFRSIPTTLWADAATLRSR